MARNMSAAIAHSFTNSPNWLHYLESCPSTNRWAIEQLDQLESGAVVFTQQQTHGRGQQGRIWYAPPGVLTLSVVLHIPTTQLSGFSLIAGLAVIDAVEELIPDLDHQLRLKWTNDVWLNGRKLAGILCEGVTHGADTKLVVGIGLNRCAEFSNLKDRILKDRMNPISLHEVASVPDQFTFLDRIRDHLLNVVTPLQSSKDSHQSILLSLLSTLRDRDALFGHIITIELPQEKVTGEAVGIDDRGCLQVQLPDQTIRTFTSGHVSKIEG
jgi:BirA family transcriptional regulator, biotin operon repressor / biotin---[acetyl-CoA-carboxylase] ligase